MRRYWALALFLAGCGGGEDVPVTPEESREWAVSAAVDKQKVQVGEDLTLTLVVTHPAEGRFVAPTGSAFAPFDLIGRSEETVSPFEARLSFRLAAYRLPEKLQIPALEIQYQKDGKMESLRTDPIPVEVVTSLTPDVTDIHDIKAPVDLEIPRDFSLLWWLLLALALALLAYLIYRKFRKEPEALKAPEWVPPLPPPDIEAEAALRRLAEKELIGRGDFAGFYT
ncbi:MAG TPA: BatD family protein, partial [Vicinamibacteria bacterium]